MLAWILNVENSKAANSRMLLSCHFQTNALEGRITIGDPICFRSLKVTSHKEMRQKFRRANQH